jgi:para-nitrobenzyl esterase
MDHRMTRRLVLSAAAAGGATLALTGLAGAEVLSAGTPTAPVDTGAGKVRGLRSGALSIFKGIPYGGDTGVHRFQPAGHARAWTGVRECFTYGPRAPQIEPLAGRAMPASTAGFPPAMKFLLSMTGHANKGSPPSEDCLVLNVYTPDASPSRKRPVMFRIHGGAYAVGSAETYDGSGLSRKGDVVVVTMNHRINALGYLYLGGIHDDFADSGNIGQLDLVLALQWVRDNIAQFGGDPNNVTIFGESGGGAKVGTLLGVAPAKGLFHKAIQESGPVTRIVDRAVAAEIGERTLQALGVAKADVHQLQTMDAMKIIAAASAIKVAVPDSDFGGMGLLAPMVDGRSIPAHPFDPIATELSRHVPLIIGSNRDESTLTMGMDPQFGRMTEEQARQRFVATLGAERGPAALEVYKARAPDDQPTYWVSTMLSDRWMRNGSIVEAQRKAAQNAAPVFMYRFDWEPPVADGVLRAFHGAEVSFVLNMAESPVDGAAPPSSEHKALQVAMSQAWINFARTGNPAQPGLAWPRYEAQKRQTMMFAARSHVNSDPDRETRKFWTT